MDTGFYYQDSSGMNQSQGISFQSSAKSSKSEMITLGDFGRMNSAGGMDFSGSSGVVNSSSSVFSGIGNSCDSIVVDSIPELKNRGGLPVEWSVEEQYKLEEALPKYADEPGIIRYVKIAATLRNKTVRDVALRCRWLARKRRKHEELNLWKKSKDKKDKLVESSLKPGLQSASTFNVAPFSVMMNNRVPGDGTHVEALYSFIDTMTCIKFIEAATRGSIRHLLERNSQVLCQISDNLSALKDNFDLFSQTKNNLSAILNDMRCMPGPPLPVSLNEDLANTIISIKSEVK
ncbi:homeodomain-like protein [Tanacetum coccineum]